MLRSFFIGLACASAPFAADSAKDSLGDPLPEGAIARLGNTRLRNIDGYNGLQIAPDGKRILSLNSGKGNMYFDMATGLPAGSLPTPQGSYALPVNLLSADGKIAVTAGYENVDIWEFATGAKLLVIKKLPGMNTDALNISLSADGQTIAFGGYYDDKLKDKPVAATVWDVKAKKEIATLKVVQNGSCQVSLSGDGKTLLTFGRQRFDASTKAPEPTDDPARKLEIWDVTAGKVKATISNRNAQSALLSPDGKTVACSSGLGDLVISDAETGKPRFELAGRSGMGYGLYFSPDGKTIAARYQSGAVQLWNPATGTSVGFAECPVQGEYLTFRGMRFTAEDRAVAVATSGLRTFAWELPSGKLISPPGGLSESIASVGFADEDKEILIAVSDRITRWSRDGKELETLRLRIPGQTQLAPRSHSATLVAGGKLAVRVDEGGLGIYDLPAGIQRCLVMSASANYGHEYIVSGDGKRGGVVVAPGYQKPEPYQFSLTDTEKGLRIGSFAFPAGQPLGLSMAHDGSKLYFFRSVRPEKGEVTISLCVLEMPSGKLIAEVPMKPGYATTKIAPTLDGKSLLVFQPDAKSNVYDATSLQFDREFKLDKIATPSGTPVFSPDGTRVAIASQSFNASAQVDLYQFADNKLIRTLKGHDRPIQAMAFSKDGKTLITGSADTTALLWDLSKD